jgi:hypothetical protein
MEGDGAGATAKQLATQAAAQVQAQARATEQATARARQATLKGTTASFGYGTKTSSDKKNEARDQKQAANRARSDKAGPRNYGGRAEGGLIQKPTTPKKPAKAKTNKRGLAARK